MAKIYREGVQIYPETTPDMVVDPTAGKNILGMMEDADNRVLEFVRGTNGSMDPKTYPFKNLGMVAGSDALQELLDGLHGGADANNCGWFRVNNQGILFEVLNFATSYANDEYAQLVMGPFTVNSSTGRIITGNTFNIGTRRHVGGDTPYWTAWDDFLTLKRWTGDRNKVFIGEADDLADFNAWLDSLHSTKMDLNIIGMFNCYINNYRNASVNNQVLSWGGEVFCQVVTGTFSPDSDGRLCYSEGYGTYMRRYSEQGGWTAWVKQ